MDIRTKTVNSIIFSLKGCKNKNKYILLINELLSLFPLHAEKSLRLCLQWKIKKYTLIKESLFSKDFKFFGNSLRINKKTLKKENKKSFSDTNVVHKEEGLGRNIFNKSKKKKWKKTNIHFFVVNGNNKYIVLKNFCSCFYFKEKVLCSNSDVLCKHILSVLLAKCFNCYSNICLNEDLFYEWYIKKLHI
ncbi:zinc finger protein, putative [Plasmodium gallinaceum]|uniref:Zinc finger protein, putative n=1 Tax=Plasmodium gallinaceum TaxID=5849 RepID=A0A1J1GPG0_PLAGA|nr:zinc finger protein, putative [Plasmodium gallinaceum]CRG94309.1 zinc finger protein, putative [Plasmodium gallinaceum]